MSQHSAHRILFDGEAFFRHGRSGITRYFAEVISEFRGDDSLGVEPLTPYHYVSNEHLAEALPGEYRQLPIPNRWRVPAMRRLNSRRIRNTPTADIVHHSLYEPEALATWQAPRRVCTVYDFTFEILPDVFPGAGPDLRDKKLFLDQCDALFCISQTTHDDLRRFHPALDKPVAVTPLGVSERFFEVPTRAIKSLPERYLLHVGNRHVHKNVDVLFRAFSSIAEKDPTVHLVLSGKGLPGEVDRLRELGIADRTHLLRVSDDQLPWLYNHAQAFVFPSLYEGFGLPVLEAMASRCTTIISETPALLEVAGDTALTFAPDDADSLANHIQSVLGDPMAQGKRHEAGTLRAKDYSWRRTAEMTSLAYDLAARS